MVMLYHLTTHQKKDDVLPLSTEHTFMLTRTLLRRHNVLHTTHIIVSELST